VAKATFRAELRSSGSGRGGHLVEVPQNVIAKLGGKGRIPVNATFDGVSYRGSIVKMRGIMMIGVTKAIMAEADIGVGDRLTVVVENDDAPPGGRGSRGAREGVPPGQRREGRVGPAPVHTPARVRRGDPRREEAGDARTARRHDDRGAPVPLPRRSMKTCLRL